MDEHRVDEHRVDEHRVDEYRVVAEDGSEAVLRGVRRDGWGGLGSACPRCGAMEYRHFVARGARYAVRDGAVVRRSDYWDSNRPLLTVCLDCERVLYKHPAFDLLYEVTGRGSSPPPSVAPY